MAKRKRLTPAQPDHFSPTLARAPEVKSMPGADFAAPPVPPVPPVPPGAPIAQVAGEAATLAALDEVTGALRDARSQGRLIEALALTSIDAAYLVRDRLVQEDDDMAALMASLRARGQQTPIEVTALSGPGPAYGLISGWRRLSALSRLYADTGEDRFAAIKALVIAPDSAQDAYLAMVEENEIRADLSLYERAHIALRAAREGVFPTPRHAVLALFGSVSRAKRSKIGKFVILVDALEPVLTHPTAIPEKLGLKLSAALAANDALASKIAKRLKDAGPLGRAEELRILSQMMAPGITAATAVKSDPVVPVSAPVSAPLPPMVPGEVVPGLRLRFDRGHRGRIELSGVRVNDALYRALKLWLSETQAESPAGSGRPR